MTDERIKAMSGDEFLEFASTLPFAPRYMRSYERLVRGETYHYPTAPDPLMECLWVYRDDKEGYGKLWGSGCPG